MGLLTWVVIGFIVGVIALQLRAGSHNKTIAIMLTISILGAAGAGWWSTSLGWEWGTPLTFNYLSALAACAGSAIPLVAYGVLLGTRHSPKSTWAED